MTEVDPGHGAGRRATLTRPVNTRRRRTLGFLLVGLLLAVATPGYLAWSLGLEVYLLHPAIFAAQAVPYLLAGAFWLPFRTAPATSISQGLAGLLLIAAGILYVPMLTGLLPMGGDMVALAFALIDVVTLIFVLAVTAIAYLFLYADRRRRTGENQPGSREARGDLAD
jgi:ABC-type xylose transport system permease subunit